MGIISKAHDQLCTLGKATGFFQAKKEGDHGNNLVARWTAEALMSEEDDLSQECNSVHNIPSVLRLDSASELRFLYDSLFPNFCPIIYHIFRWNIHYSC